MTSGYAIATLVVFIVSTCFVIYPVSIPTPRHIPRIPINLTTAPILGIALLWAAQCLGPTVIRNGIVGTEDVQPYNVIILFFSLAYMTITLDITGVLRAAAFWVSNKGGNNGWKLYLYFYIMLTLLATLLGNDPVILSGTLFLVYFAEVANLDPRVWVMAEFTAANTASMVLFVGNLTNVVICEGFSVNNAAFTAYTILPFIACSIFCFVALAFQNRKKVPRKLMHATRQDPRKALLDPFGACVGSFMLGATLILCLIVSFLGIDVWMISLPFAGAKLLFDVCRDYYRYTRGLPPLRPGSSDSVNTVEQGLSRDSQVEKQLDTQDSSHESHRPPVCDVEKSESPPSEETAVEHTDNHKGETQTTKGDVQVPYVIRLFRSHFDDIHHALDKRFPTLVAALPRLPFALVPFSFSQFILIEALDHQGWVQVFADWLVRASHKQVHPTVWIIGVMGVILCNLSGTNIGATILLTKIVRAAALPYDASRAAAIALAIVSNVGAVSFTFSASLAGLLWRGILEQKKIHVRQRDFALWNLLPISVMTVVGLGVVSAEMAVLFQS